jgi:hypothetical protein
MLDIYEGPSGHRITHHNDDNRFSKTSEDVQILRTLHAEDPGWIFVGGDGKILRNRVEMAVLAECNLTYLILNHTWCNKKIEDTCWMMIKLWPSITSGIERLKAPSVIELKYTSSRALDVKGATATFLLPR